MDTVFTVKEVAERLKVSNDTVYRWISEGKLKSLKFAGTVRISEEDLDRFVKNGQSE